MTGKQAWVKEMSDFVKSIDPNHLTMVGTWGYFGQSSPDLLPENPYDLSWRTSNLSNDAGIWSAGEYLTSWRVSPDPQANMSTNISSTV